MVAEMQHRFGSPGYGPYVSSDQSFSYSQLMDVSDLSQQVRHLEDGMRALEQRVREAERWQRHWQKFLQWLWDTFSDGFGYSLSRKSWGSSNVGGGGSNAMAEGTP